MHDQKPSIAVNSGLRWLRPQSLKSTLLWLLIPSVAIAMALSFWASTQELRSQVNAAFDRSLAGALRSIQVNLRTESGGLGMEQPFYLLEFLSLTTGGTAYFRISSENGLTELGFTELPLPTQPLKTNEPVFYDGDYYGEPLRLAAVAVEIDRGSFNERQERVILVVAEDVRGRDDFLERVRMQSFRKDVIVLMLMIALLLAGVLMVVRPLKLISEEIKNRSFDDLQPIDPETLPREVRPLVQAINLHMQKYAEKAKLQKQFLDDASHQLRTPLSVLTTQVEYARQLAKSPEMKEVLDAILNKLRNTVRLTNQMLSLAKVHDAADKLAMRAPVSSADLCQIARDVVAEFLPAARRRRMDFGLDCPDEPVKVRAIDWLVSQALSNLVSNALIYCQEGARITVIVRQTDEAAVLEVEDNGPGMSDQDMALASHRFRRGEAGRKMQGSGLGLAIVQTVAQLNNAKLELERPQQGTGLIARLVFPTRH